MTTGGAEIRVLHVDDDPRLTEVAGRLLEREDPRIEVTTATAGEAALEILETDRVDCVVADYYMPGMDGLELYDAVLEIDPDVPFILFTGKGNEAVAGEAVSAGVTDYLQKSRDDGQYGLLANRITNAVESARTERRLAAERRRFRVLFEHFPEPTLSYRYEDGEPQITAVNEAFTEVFGYDAATAVGEAVDDLIVPSNMREEAERIDERVRAGDLVDEHLRRRTADGIREFRFRHVGFPEGDGVDGYAIYADITDRVHREWELERRNDLFRRAQELADVGAWEYDPATEDLSWSEGVYDVFGVPRSFEPTPAAAFEFYHPEDRDAVKTAVDRALADRERFDVEARIETGAGAVRWLRTHGSPLVDDGEVVRLRGAIQDVTDRKEQLATISDLQHSAQRLVRAGDPDTVAEIAVDIATTALEQPFAGVYLVDDAGSTLEPVAVTEAVRDRFDATPTFERTDPDSAADRLVWGAYEAGDPGIVEDVREWEPPTGAVEPARSGVVFPLGEHGVFLAASPEVAALSETDRYLADILATVLTATLDRTDRERALRSQKELLEEQTERLEELVSVISHDLQSPLNVADGRLELAQADCDSRHLEDAASAVDRSRAIVEDLLALGREGDRGGERTVVGLPSLARDCWVSVVSGDATLQVEIDRQVRADRSRLRHLLENLFRNAVEHGSTSPGSQARQDAGSENASEPSVATAPEDAVEHGSTSPPSQAQEDAVEHGSTSPDSHAHQDAIEDGSASLPLQAREDSNERGPPPEQDPVTVTVGHLEDGFYVADDGVGVPPDDRAAVFESGYSSGDGTGLGLSIVRQVATEHGWDVSLVGSDAGGARFEFTGVESPER